MTLPVISVDWYCHHEMMQLLQMSYIYKEQTIYFHELKEILQMVLLSLNFSVSI